MKAGEITFQAENFLRWHGRAGGDLETNFRWWAQRKDFWPDDERAIWTAIEVFTSVEVAELVAVED